MPKTLDFRVAEAEIAPTPGGADFAVRPPRKNFWTGEAPAAPSAPGRGLRVIFAAAVVFALALAPRASIPAAASAEAYPDSVALRATLADDGSVALATTALPPGTPVDFVVRGPGGSRTQKTHLAGPDSVARLVVPAEAFATAGEYFSWVRAEQKISPEILIFTKKSLPAAIRVSAERTAAAPGEAVPVRAAVTDSAGAPVAGVAVDFATDRTAAVSPRTAETDSAGIARAEVSAFSPGSLRVAARAGELRAEPISLRISAEDFFEKSDDSDFWQNSPAAEPADFWGGGAEPAAKNSAVLSESAAPTPAPIAGQILRSAQDDGRAGPADVQSWRSSFFSKINDAGTAGYASVIDPAAAASPGGAFEAEILTGDLRVGIPASIRVTALTPGGVLDEKYRGAIEFSSTDPKARFPEDARILAEHGGTRTFDLAVVFGTAGVHELTIRDRDDAERTVTLTGIRVGEAPTDSTAPRILAPTGGAELSSGDLRIAGRATGGARVSIYDGETLLGETIADEAGGFLLEVSGLFDGTHRLTAVAVGIDGKISPVSDPVVVRVDTAPPRLDRATVTPTDPAPGDLVRIEIFSEENLLAADAAIEGRIVALAADPGVPGRYAGEFRAPEGTGVFAVGVRLTDEVGNRADFDAAASIRVLPAATPEPERLPAPTGVRVVSAAGERVTLAWDAVPGAASFEILSGVEPGSLDRIERVLPGRTEWWLDGFRPAVGYFFAVRAVGTDGQFGEISSPPVSATIAPPAPTGAGFVRVRRSEWAARAPAPETGPGAAAAALLAVGVGLFVAARPRNFFKILSNSRQKIS